MNTVLIASLGDLVGPWSAIAFALGLLGLSTGILVSRKILGWATGAMIMLAAFVLLVGLPASRAYSGPIPAAERHLADYDKYLAAGIALVFAGALAFERLRLRRASK